MCMQESLMPNRAVGEPLPGALSESAQLCPGGHRSALDPTAKTSCKQERSAMLKRHGNAAGRSAAVIALLAVLLISTAPSVAEEARSSKCDLGVTLALSGDVAEAESVFVSLLSSDPAGTRALTNLGNIHLMKGELEVALAFYDMAFRGDPEDPGILLNRSVALMLLGEEDMARSQAKEGIDMAGGMKEASSMLGLKWTELDVDASKGAEETYVNKEEVEALLRAALQSVPSDSAKVDTTATGEAKKKRRMSWRAAGARAADGTQVGQVLYWKR